MTSSVVNAMTKNVSNLIILLVAQILVSANSFAEPKGLALIPLPSIADYTSGDGWASAVGLKMAHSSVYDGADTYALEINPEFAIQWRSAEHVFFLDAANIDGLELGWRALMQNDWFMQAGVRHETVLPAGDTLAANINNFPHRGSHVIAFLESRHAIGRGWRNWVSGRLSAGPASFGYRGLMAVGHSFAGKLDGTGIVVVLFSSVADKKNINNYFGITQSDAAASGLAQADLSGGYRSTRLKLTYRKNLMDNMQITIQAGLEIYSDNIKKSAIVRDTSETSAAISALWRF